MIIFCTSDKSNNISLHPLTPSDKEKQRSLIIYNGFNEIKLFIYEVHSIYKGNVFADEAMQFSLKKLENLQIIASKRLFNCIDTCNTTRKNALICVT